MAATHYLMYRSLEPLSDIFLASRTDWGALEELECELKYRRVPQALTLLLEVRHVLDGSRRCAPATTGGR